MAIIGLKRPVIAEIDTETTSATTYKSGQILAKAISANVTINNAGTDPLFADDEAAETASGFSDGTIELGIDDLTDAIAAYVLGHQIVNVGGVDELQASTEDVGLYLGLGFTRIRIKNGVKTYQAKIIKKVQFSEPSEETTTKGKSIEWQTPTLSGTILVPADKMWKRQATFATEAEATNWIDGILNTTAVSKTALNAKITVIDGLNKELYTSATWGPMAVSRYLAGLVSMNAESSQAAVDAALADLTSVQGDLILA
jgi:phi13 family phage major tail protein